MIVYHEGMSVKTRAVAMRVPMRLWPLPPLVLVTMMLVVNVQMFMVLFDMPVRQKHGIVTLPDQDGNSHAGERTCRHDDEGDIEA